MKYLENHFDKRIDPRKLVEGAKTVVSLMFNYFPEAEQTDPEAPKLAKYAYGEDYHYVLKDKLKTLLGRLKEKVGDVSGRCFVDSAPVLERDWAKRSGLGWIGKNTLLITPRKGSFFFLAELIVDVEFEYDAPIKDYCGSCRRCIDACPTDAISEKGYLMDASKCISYLTIELRNEIPKEFTNKMENWVFGCDICQDVCPWNRFSKAHKEPAFNAKEGLLEMKKSDWMEITEEVFKNVFKNSAIK
jgi:epoxyqueuosine reductase